jgi:hypothetical protein
MFVILAIVIGLIVGAARGGSIGLMRKRKINLWPIGLVGIILQIVLHLYFYFGQASGITTFLNFASYVCILLMLIFNFDDLWAILLTVGTTANFIVAFINGGKMPVTPTIVSALTNANLSAGITRGINAVYTPLSRATTALWMLGINTQIPYVSRITSYYGGVGGFSIGSVLVFVGLLGWVQHAMQGNKQQDPFSEELNEGDADYIISPDENSMIEEMAQKKETGYETGPLDWLNQDSETLFGQEIKQQTGEIPPVKPEKKAARKPRKRRAPQEPARPEADATKGHKPEEAQNKQPEKTTVLPDLSPELLDRIKSHNSGAAKKRPASTVSDDTRVFTTLKDLGKYDTKPIDTGFSASAQRERKEAEDFAESGFFTQSFYTEREKGKLAFGSQPSGDSREKAAKPTETYRRAINNQEDKNQMADYKPTEGDTVKSTAAAEQPKPAAPKRNTQQTTTQSSSASRWEMPEKTKKTKAEPTAKKINPYRKYSDEEAARRADASRDNEKQMLNIWHQVSEDTRALRQRGRRSASEEVQSDSPFSRSEAERKRLKQQHNRAAAQKSENEIASAQKPKAGGTKKQAAAANVTNDEDRERIGFEKVEINVDNRKVSFWRKKKS